MMPSLHPLTARELECMITYYVYGGIKEAARMLGLTPDTVKVHMRIARNKTLVNKSTHLINAILVHYEDSQFARDCIFAQGNEFLLETSSWLPNRYKDIIHNLLHNNNVTN